MVSKRRYQDVALKIRDILQRSHFVSGDKLPSERQLAQRLDVSRSLLREALIMLEIEGLITIRKGSGIYIADNSTATNALNTHNDIGPFELIQARQLVESNIAEMAAWQVTKNDIADMQTTLDDERSAIHAGILDYDNDKKFHISIAKATQNSVLSDLVENLWMQRERSPMWLKLHENIFNDSYRLQWLNDHQEILNALKRKSPTRAKKSMWVHLENVRETLMTLSDPEHPQFDGFLFDSQPLIGIKKAH